MRIERWLMIAVLLLAAGTRLHRLGDDARFHGDEALFATYARTAAVHGDWWLGGALDKPPMALYLMAVSMQGVGVTVNPLGVLDLGLKHGEWAARLPSVFLGVLACAALIGLARRLTGDRLSGLLAGAIWAASPMAAGFDALALTDAPMLMGVALALSAASARRFGMAGAFWAFAFASKQQALFALPLVLVLAWQAGGWRAVWRSGGVAALGVGLLTGWDVLRPGDSINSVAAGNNNPYRWLAEPNEWPARTDFWLAVTHTAFGMFTALLPVLGALTWIWRTRHKGAWFRQPSVLLTGWALAYFAAHVVLPFNLYERYALPALLVLTVPAAWGIAQLSRGRNRTTLPTLLVVGLLVIPTYQPTTPRDRDDNLIHLGAFINAQGLGTIVYNRWLGWEMGYYLGAWSDKRMVYYPTPQDLAADAPRNPDRAPRLFIAPRWAWPQAPDWLAAVESVGFAVTPAYNNWGYAAWWLTPPEEP